MQQSAFSFDEAAATPPPTPSGPDKAWLDAAVSTCFGAKKWAALPEDVREQLQDAMWGYAQARERSIRRPVGALDAEDAMRGWVLADANLAREVRMLHAHLIAPADVPRISGAVITPIKRYRLFASDQHDGRAPGASSASSSAPARSEP